jgi:hypothetical protein
MSPSEFNTYESIFWLTLSSLLIFAYRYVPIMFKKWILFSAVNIFLFGISDVIEVYTGGFLHTAPWLLVWKILNVIGLLFSIVWYFYLRLKKQ